MRVQPWWFFFPLILLLLTSAPVAVATATTTLPSAEIDALLAFKANMVSDPENVLSTWNTSTDPCTAWHGVTCSAINASSTNDATPHVVGLTLQSSLGGVLTYQIGNLTQLQYLRLRSNSLTGAIPLQVCALANLLDLDLSDNSFYGSIPANISDLRLLQTLDLSYNNLSGPLRSGLGAMPQLVELQLHNNQLNGSIPAEVFLAPQLKTLTLGNNNLAGDFPWGILNASRLQYFSAEGNSLTGSLPPNLGNLFRLGSFVISGNQIGGSIPESIGNLQRMLYLFLDDNRLSGTIPVNLSYLPKLMELSLSSNGLWGAIPGELFGLTALTLLNLSNNALNGSIPRISAGAANLSSLITLHLGSNSLTGAIPDTLGGMVKLVNLDLSNNHLTGTIPDTLGDAVDLTNLDLSSNSLTGNIPSTLRDIANLTSLDLSYNNLTGNIPSTLGDIANLTRLDLSDNNLTGNIPGALGDTANLTSLDLSDNNLTGSIPTSLAAFPSSSFLGNPSLCGAPLSAQDCGYVIPSSPASNYYPTPSKESDSSNKNKIIVGAVVGGLGLLILCCLLLFFVLRRKNARRGLPNWFGPAIGSARRKGRMQMFVKNFKPSYDDVVSGSGFYDTAHVLGKGRFATVYRCSLPQQQGVAMAVKVLKFASTPTSFEREVEKLALLTHRNLLGIKGFYSSSVEKAIFYDYMPNGSLYEVLHKQRPDGGYAAAVPPIKLDWPMRHRIALDTANALLFLHKGNVLGRVIHKDVKSSNILFDEEMVAHLGDFGLVGLVASEANNNIPTMVETAGYTAPEVKSASKYSEKSDIYSFGVVLLELVSGKKPVSKVGDRTVNLVNWATRVHRAGRGREVIDSTVAISAPTPEHLDKALNLAIMCVHTNPSQRPTLMEITSILETLTTQPSPMPSPEVAERPLLT